MDELPKSKGARGKKEDEDRPAEAEARAIDVKVKGADDGGAMLQGNLDLLKKMQEEQWKNFEWIDAEVSGHLVSSPFRRRTRSDPNIFLDRRLMVHL
jgi:hypothetical protein